MCQMAATPNQLRARIFDLEDDNTDCDYIIRIKDAIIAQRNETILALRKELNAAKRKLAELNQSMDDSNIGCQ